MNETHQLASAMWRLHSAVYVGYRTIVIEYRASKYPLVQAVKTASLAL